MVEAGGIGKGGGATAAEVMDGSSTGRCNGRRYGSSVAITIDSGGSNGQRRRNGWWDGSANSSTSVMDGGSSYAREPPLSVFFSCFWC